MTRSQFEVIAQGINRYIEYMRDRKIGDDRSDSQLISIFEELLQSQNSMFKVGRFEEACLDGLSSRKKCDRCGDELKGLGTEVEGISPFGKKLICDECLDHVLKESRRLTHPEEFQGK